MSFSNHIAQRPLSFSGWLAAAGADRLGCISFALLLSHLTFGCGSHAESGRAPSRPWCAWRPGCASPDCHVSSASPYQRCRLDCAFPRPLFFASHQRQFVARTTATGRPAVQRSRLRARLIPSSLPPIPSGQPVVDGPSAHGRPMHSRLKRAYSGKDHAPNSPRLRDYLQGRGASQRTILLHFAPTLLDPMVCLPGHASLRGARTGSTPANCCAR